MIFDALGNDHFTRDDIPFRQDALDSAIVYRNRSFEADTTPAESRALRSLMRQQAIIWRRSRAPKS
jgi:hypothetical protein